jgi:ribonucleoside-diphosphate reductase beta chain
MTDIFTPRTNIKPYEYPQLYHYIPAIRNSYWVHTEYNYTSDIHDLKVGLSRKEKSVLINAVLAISQIENQVKEFWGNIGKKLPKPEIKKVGATFSESEVRHEDAYSHILDITNLNNKFEEVINTPSIKGRIKYLNKILKISKSRKPVDVFKSIILFSMFIENVSLFSQFLIIMSFNKHQNTLKGISNAVEATSKEENLHAQFGFDLVNIIKQENPEWWNEELINELIKFTHKAYEAEKGIIEWIFEEGDLDFIDKEICTEFIKQRFNESLNAIGLKSEFEINDDILLKTEWFTDEVDMTKRPDFFNKRSINYNKKSKAITEDELF